MALQAFRLIGWAQAGGVVAIERDEENAIATGWQQHDLSFQHWDTPFGTAGENLTENLIPPRVHAQASYTLVRGGRMMYEEISLFSLFIPVIKHFPASR